MKKLQETIDKLPDKFDLDFGEDNSIFAGEFYHYTADDEVEVVKNATIFVTKQRKDVLLKILKNLKEHGKEIRQLYVLDGPQGIGKTYTILSFSHCLSTNEKVKLIHIQLSEKLDLFFKEEIVKQLDFSFFEENLNLDSLYKLDVNSLLQELNELLIKYKKKGYILILIIDQLNHVKNDAQCLLKELLRLSWNICLCSQSSNNGINEQKSWKYISDTFFFSEEEIKQLKYRDRAQ